MSYQVIRVVITGSVLLQFLSCSRVDDTTLTVEETMGSLFLFGPKYASLANTNAKPLLYRLLDGPEAERQIRGGAIVMLGYVGSGVDATNLERRLRENYIGALRPNQWGDVEAIPMSLAVMARRGVPEASELLAKMTKPDYWG